ncbi:hypothetical protein LHYA1_G000859 [Lachnellula hyalina]|uniref:F-box domain-containing protein n=1 Tax=Lachnellula hyalina TaxID=1316788 RepID=A0A8H8U406_9HELO|nr:uncharacterized protein LHYA1_G000859 [Lachnellula hyalina]TVY29712.1 hypothetical protein LHYA1_G000859 [Lachnellula hyalina]
MFGLLCVPYEVLANIVGNIDFDDVFNLALVCKELKFIVMEENICKNIVQVSKFRIFLFRLGMLGIRLSEGQSSAADDTCVQTKIKFSNEALTAASAGGGNARALRRAAKRRNALATVNPFTVATIGVCDAFVYLNGVLCYTLDDKVRVLDLHNSSGHEVVISIPGLLTQALSDIQDNNRGTFQILYYSDKITSCLYRSSGSDSTAWLIAFHVGYRAILLVKELDSTEKIFVRHNSKFLYFGTNSELGNDGHKKWVIQGYSFETKEWFKERIHLPDMVGNEIGSTICFEFHKTDFYALSNQTSFEVEEIDWTSFYHCIRFPLDSPYKELIEKTENKQMWRRQHQEGPIDDRWTFLRLDTDETTGKLKIVESRKEWYLGASRSQRTYYTTKIKFPKPKHDDSEYSSPEPSAASAASPTSSDNLDITILPNLPIVKLRNKDDNPNYLEAPQRKPLYTHPGNDGSMPPTYTLANTLIRTYHTSSSTFLDLVNDPLPTDWRSTQRLRLRGSSRTLGPPLTDPTTGISRDPSPDLTTALAELFPHAQPISFFPRAGADQELYDLLNPPNHLGCVDGVMDDRSMVYVTGPANAPQALIFVGFDAGIRLEGLKRWGAKGVGEGPHIDGRATGCNIDGLNADVGGNGNLPEGAYAYEDVRMDVEEGKRMLTIDRKGKGKAVDSEGEGMNAHVLLGSGKAVDVDMDVHAAVTTATATAIADTGKSGPPSSASGTAGRWAWAWREKAMYRDISRGYNFGSAQSVPS